VDWFTGMFRTFLNVNGDTLVALLVAAGTDEIDRDVFDGKTRVSSQEIDPDQYQERFATADAAD